jgi:hypothetical protein
MIASLEKFPTWGHPQSQWDRAKAQAKKKMIEIARRRSAIAYSELVTAIEAISFQPDEKPFHNLLGQISIEEEQAGRGMLSVLVVHKGGDFRPGPGFFELAQELGRDTHDRDRFWAQELQRVYDAWPRT